MNHLEKKHNVKGLRTEKASLKHGRENEELDQWLSAQPVIKRRKCTEYDQDIDEAMLIELFGEYIVDEDLPVNHSESRTLRNLLFYINPAACDLLPVSRGQTRKNLVRSHRHRKSRILEILQSATSLIHLTPDGWTSPNGLGILGIVAHFMSQDHGLQHLVRAVKELFGAHSGANMAAVTLSMLEEYESLTTLATSCLTTSPPTTAMLEIFRHVLKHQGYILITVSNAFAARVIYLVLWSCRSSSTRTRTRILTRT